MAALGDTAYNPYGDNSGRNKTDTLRFLRIISQEVQYLVNERDDLVAVSRHHGDRWSIDSHIKGKQSTCKDGD